MKPRIAFAGMTHLGLVSSVAAAAKGFEVLGFDPDAALVGALQAGRLPIVEPDLDDTLAANAERLAFTSRIEDLAGCNVVFLSADVPTGDDGGSDLSPIRRLIETVLPHLGADAVFVVLCQVPPGFTRTVGRDGAHLFYQVETLIFGRAMERALLPERIIVGKSDSGLALPPAYRAYLDAFGCPVLPMVYESAELAKIAINCFLVAQVTTTNTLAGLAERIGADWGEIAPALRLDARIGPKAYLGPGLGLAGGNLERDLATVQALACQFGSEAGLIDAMTANSSLRKDWMLTTLHREVLSKMPNPVIAVLGLAYKENTRSTKNSPSLALISCLKDWQVRVFDPVVDPEVLTHPKLVAAPSALAAAQGADVLVIATAWPEFRSLTGEVLEKVMRGRTVIDPWCVLASAPGFDHFVLGVPPRREASLAASS